MWLSQAAARHIPPPLPLSRLFPLSGGLWNDRVRKAALANRPGSCVPLFPRKGSLLPLTPGIRARDIRKNAGQIGGHRLLFFFLVAIIRDGRGPERLSIPPSSVADFFFSSVPLLRNTGKCCEHRFPFFLPLHWRFFFPSFLEDLAVDVDVGLRVRRRPKGRGGLLLSSFAGSSPSLSLPLLIPIRRPSPKVRSESESKDLPSLLSLFSQGSFPYPVFHGHGTRRGERTSHSRLSSFFFYKVLSFFPSLPSHVGLATVKGT